VAAKKSSGEAKETLEVIDVAQLLVRSSAARPVVAADPDASGDADEAAPAAEPSAVVHD
jgi:hypothetical protein